MFRRFGIAAKIVILMVVLMLITSAAIILVNRLYYQRDMRRQLQESQLPLVSDKILAAVDAAILEPTRAITMLVKEPFFLDWIRAGEPAEREDTVYQMLEAVIASYGTMTANYASDASRRYFAANGRERNTLTMTTDGAWSWYDDVMKGAADTAINVYVGDPDWGTSAYINVRIKDGNDLLGLISISINIETLAAELNSLAVGERGLAFIVDDKGVFRFAEDKAWIGSPVEKHLPAYLQHWSDITGRDRSSIAYKAADGDHVAVVSRVPVLGWWLVSEAALGEFDVTIRRTLGVTAGISLVFLALGSLMGVVFARSITRPLDYVASGLVSEADQMAALAAEVSHASDNLDQSARNQSAVVEGAGASISEMSTAINDNANNAKMVEDLMQATEADVQAGFDAIQQMTSAMSEINTSSQEIGKILKTIEDISFQTNLLALNAAVEAARAGEAGKGFAVVADDVRNLAQRSAASVKESEVQITETSARVQRGATLVGALEDKFKAIMESMTKVAEMVKKIGESTYEQTNGVEHVNQAMAQVDKNTAETTNEARAMTEISGNIGQRVESLRGSIAELGRILNRRIERNGGVAPSRQLRGTERPRLPYGGHR